jgi:hypothetical protein
MMQRAMDGRREEKRRECMMLVQLKRELNNAQNEASLFVLFPFFLKKNSLNFFFLEVRTSEAEKISLNCQEQRERTSEKHPRKHPQKHAPTKPSSMGFVYVYLTTPTFANKKSEHGPCNYSKAPNTRKYFCRIFEKIGSDQKNPTEKNIMPTLID